MNIDFAELDRMLDTFIAQSAMHAVAATRQLAQQDGAIITKSDRAVPTKELLGIYRRRAKNPQLSPAAAAECAELASLAERCPDEGWHIYIVKLEHDEGAIMATVFANQAAIGRICFDPELSRRSRRRNSP